MLLVRLAKVSMQDSQYVFSVLNRERLIKSVFRIDRRKFRRGRDSDVAACRIDDDLGAVPREHTLDQKREGCGSPHHDHTGEYPAREPNNGMMGCYFHGVTSHHRNKRHRKRVRRPSRGPAKRL